MLYSYTVRTTGGRTDSGEIEENDEMSAVKSLRAKKFIVLDIKEKRSSHFFDYFETGVPLKDRIIFLKQITIMIKSGLALIDSLEALKEQTTNKYLAKITGEMAINIRGGKSFSDSLKKYPKVFSPIFINVISSGEKSGKFEEVLQRLTDQAEKDYDLSSKVQNALMYPVIVLIAIVGVMIIILVYIVPQIKKIFEEMNTNLPLITRIILWISNFFIHWWWVITLAIIGLIILVKTSLATREFRQSMDNLKIKLPIFGTFIKKMYMANFTRNMATLISSGLPVLECLEVTKKIFNNLVYENALNRVYKEVENGEQLSTSIKKEKIFPAMIPQLINIGEKSGKLDYVLNGLADFFDKEVESTTRNLTTILEPVLTIMMGIGVALVVASVIVPIYGLVNVI